MHAGIPQILAVWEETGLFQQPRFHQLTGKIRVTCHSGVLRKHRCCANEDVREGRENAWALLRRGLRGTDLSRLSEVLHEDDVSTQRIELCVKDCSTVLRNSHPGRFAGRAVLQLENFRRPLRGEVEKSD